jgi:AcrR family transcriptional regulator
MSDFPKQPENLAELVDIPRKTRRGYGGRSADALAQERRQRLLDAGFELFGTQGYASTNTEQICRAAKVTTRHFYEQFTDKEALLITLFDAQMQDTLHQVTSALIGSVRPLPERLFEGLEAFLDAQLNDVRRARLTTIEILGVSAQAESRRHTVIGQFVQLIEMYFAVLVQQGHAPDQPYQVLAVAIVGAMHELQIAHLRQPEVFDRASMTQALHGLLSIYVQGLMRQAGTDQM